MNTDYLRIINYTTAQVPPKTSKAIFHKWLTKEGEIKALIEDFESGKVVFVSTENITFLNFQQTTEFWDEVKNRPLV